MAWTTPRTWVDGETVSQSEMNADVRDNLDFLFTASTKPDQNAQVGTGSSAYTFALADAAGGKIVLANAASAATYTVPQDSSVNWPAGSVIRVVSVGAGVITFAAGSGATVNNTAATLSQYESATLIKTAANTWQVIKGGGLPKASVSATTGSPGVDTSSRPGKTIYTFTGSGSITLTAGVIELLVYGAGGSGGAGTNRGPGGGAGGTVVYKAAYYVDSAGTFTVTVGGGGAGVAPLAVGSNGSPSVFDKVQALGGGYGGSGEDGSIGGSRGNGGGGGTFTGTGGVGGTALVPAFGYDGGSAASGGTNRSGGGGAGAGAVGSASTSGAAGAGGTGVSSSITGSAVLYGAGGGGASYTGTQGAAGGTGASAGVNSGGSSNATANTGAGSGGSAGVGNSGNAASGGVIIVIG